MPIIEPEVDINAPDKREAEDLLRGRLLAHLNGLAADVRVRADGPPFSGHSGKKQSREATRRRCYRDLTPSSDSPPGGGPQVTGHGRSGI